MATLNLAEAARMIGVSSATVRNWVRAGLVQPLPDRNAGFDESEISRLKSDLVAGRLPRLRSRANKTKSDSQFVPAEYAENKAVHDTVVRLSEWRKKHDVSVETLLFFVAIRLLERAGDLATSLQEFDRVTWRRNCVRDEMRQWHGTLPQKPDFKIYGEIARHFNGVDGDSDIDWLGVLHQALFREGEKSHAGAYYTPTLYVRDALQEAGLQPGETLLDPCCGTGKYLVTAVRCFALRPESCHGFDIDPLAVRLARVNLFLAAPKHEFVPRVQCVDALTEETTDGFDCFFDLVATNPPWGARKNTGEFTKVKHAFRESFALFLVKSLSSLRENGRLSFLLPEAFLNIKTHAGIRKLVLTQTSLNSVTALGRGFSGVYTGAIRLDAVKTKPRSGHSCRVTGRNGDSYCVEQAVFLRNRDQVFDIDLSPEDRGILDKIFATPHQTLANNADWALGIVTGDNAKHLTDKPSPGFEPVFRGADIEPYRLREPTTFLKFDPSQFQQTAPEAMYRVPEKIVYRFISKKLVFALDTNGRLTLNSANVLLPRLPGMSTKVVLAFLNSTLFRYVFEKKFSTHKVLRGDLEQLPFPEISRETHDVIEACVDAAMARLNPESENSIDTLVFACFPNLTERDIRRIANAR